MSADMERVMNAHGQQARDRYHRQAAAVVTAVYVGAVVIVSLLVPGLAALLVFVVLALVGRPVFRWLAARLRARGAQGG
jgi:hypothetical protein